MHRDFVYTALEVFDAVGSFTHTLILCETRLARQAMGPRLKRAGPR